MNANTSGGRSSGGSGTTGLVSKRMLQVGVGVLIQAAILFISSGRLDWVMAWAYLGVYVGAVAINASIMLRNAPELAAERAEVKEGAKGWDRVLAPLVGACGPAVTLIVAGLDVRFGWSPRLALAIQLVALALVALGYLLFGWAMASNRFFSGVVRIQKERGHTVVTAGPYQYVRHPGYVAVITYSLATPLLLGSLWALIPAGLTVCITVVRTALEDRTLLAELDGYEDYARRVRYRLVPGVW